MRHWKIEIKEKGNNQILTPEYIGDDSFDRNACIEFFGLNESDVEWYKLVEVNDKNN